MSDRWNPCEACVLGLYYDPKWCPKVCEYAEVIKERDEIEKILRNLSTELDEYYVSKALKGDIKNE